MTDSFQRCFAESYNTINTLIINQFQPKPNDTTQKSQKNLWDIFELFWSFLPKGDNFPKNQALSRTTPHGPLKPPCWVSETNNGSITRSQENFRRAKRPKFIRPFQSHLGGPSNLEKVIKKMSKKKRNKRKNDAGNISQQPKKETYHKEITQVLTETLVFSFTRYAFFFFFFFFFFFWFSWNLLILKRGLTWETYKISE